MGAETADDLLSSGRNALAVADWEGARSLFERARQLGETAEVLDGLSQAAHFQGQYERAIELKKRAFAAYRRRGKRAEASELARWLAFLHGTVQGNMAAASGWMARAERLLEGGGRMRRARMVSAPTTLRSPATRPSRERPRPSRRSPSAGGTATPTSSSTRWPCWARSTWSRDAGSRE